MDISVSARATCPITFQSPQWPGFVLPYLPRESKSLNGARSFTEEDSRSGEQTSSVHLRVA